MNGSSRILISGKKLRLLGVLCLLGVLSIPLAHAGTPPDAPTVILIQNATIMTVSHGTIEHGSILIKDGKIAEVGQSITAPKEDRKSTRLNSSHVD